MINKLVCIYNNYSKNYMLNVVNKIDSKNSEVILENIDEEESHYYINRFGITRFPAFILLKEESILKKIIGNIDIYELQNHINNYT